MSERDLFATLPARALGRRADAISGPVTDAQIRRGRALAARAVLLYGERYMPIYERLGRELAARESQAATLERLRIEAAE